MTPVYPILAFVVTALLLWGGRRIALRVGYADKPGGRKRHEQPVPPIGGLAVLPVFMGFSYFGGFSDILPWPLFAGLAFLLVMGAVDDARPINSALKFALMVWVACFVVIFGHGQITHVGNLFGFGMVELGIFTLPFSVMCLVLFMNALNMIDGVDGLAGGFCALMTFWMMVVCYAAGQWAPFWSLLILLCCLLAFLAFNLRSPFLRSAKIFLGDSGALCMGMLLGWFSIKLTQGAPAPLSPATVIWIIAIPVMDAFALFLARSIRGLHPFNADRRHLHHRLMDAGISPARTTAMILGGIAFFALVGFVAQAKDIPPAILFYLWMVIFIGHTAVLMSARAYSAVADFFKRFADPKPCA